MQLVSSKHQPDWSERRQTIKTWIEFVGDFGQIDVGSLLPCVEDDAFVEAFEAVLKLGGRPWAVYECARDFCVQRLYGEKPIARTGAPRLRHRVTPFSVPIELLKSVFAPPEWRDDRAFKPGRLRIRDEGFVLDMQVDAEAEHRFYVSQEQMLLLTTVWARVVPPVEPLRHQVTIIDEGANRMQTFHLWALVAEPQPLFMPLTPNCSVSVRVQPGATREGEKMPAHVLMALEGWSYLL